MEKIVVKGVKELKGEVDISSAKNSILPIIAATILCSEPIIIENTPKLEDVEVICKLLNELNCDVDISNINKPHNIKKMLTITGLFSIYAAIALNFSGCFK